MILKIEEEGLGCKIRGVVVPSPQIGLATRWNPIRFFAYRGAVATGDNYDALFSLSFYPAPTDVIARGGGWEMVNDDDDDNDYNRYGGQ